MEYKIQIDDLIRDATAEGIAKIQLMELESVAKESEILTKAEAKTALLERLGITADEAALLLG